MLSLDTVPAATRTIPRAVLAVAGFVLVPTAVARLRGVTDMNGVVLFSSLIAGAGCGYAIDDAAARTFASSPTQLVFRRGVRASLVALLLLVAWLATFLVASLGSTAHTPSVGSMAPYAVAAAALSLAVACLLRPDVAASPGLVAVFTTLLSMVFLDAMSFRFDVVPSLHGSDAKSWWWIAGGAAVAALYASRDPAGRALTRRRR
ncbi:MAG: hypothetical protein QOI61_1683 [Actinomycetota bacterium]